MKVEVRPLDMPKWHKKTGKDSFAQSKVLEVPINGKTGKYETGLTEEETEKYGKILGVDLSDIVLPEAAHPFWSTKAAWITLPNHTVIFDTSNPRDFVKVKNLKANNRVANSMREWEEGLFPQATHVIYDESEEIEAKAKKAELHEAAIAILSKLTLEDKISIATVLSNGGLSINKQSANFVTVEMHNLINKDVREFLRVAKMGKEEVNLRAKIFQMADKEILTRSGGAYYYMGDMIGLTVEDVIVFFKDPKNIKLRVLLMERLEKS